MSGPKYSPAAIREIWQKEGETALGRPSLRPRPLPADCRHTSIDTEQTRVAEPKLRVLASQNNIRGRFIGDVVGNGIVVAELNEEGLPVPDKKPTDQRADVRCGLA
jgi:hypothetical protein